MQIVEHEASVAVDAPIQRCGLDGLPSARDSVGFDDIGCNREVGAKIG